MTTCTLTCGFSCFDGRRCLSLQNDLVLSTARLTRSTRHDVTVHKSSKYKNVVISCFLCVCLSLSVRSLPSSPPYSLLLSSDKRLYLLSFKRYFVWKAMTNLISTQRVCVYCYLMFATFVVNYYRTFYQLVCIIYFVQQFIVRYKWTAAVKSRKNRY